MFTARSTIQYIDPRFFAVSFRLARYASLSQAVSLLSRETISLATPSLSAAVKPSPSRSRLSLEVLCALSLALRPLRMRMAAAGMQFGTHAFLGKACDGCV